MESGDNSQKHVFCLISERMEPEGVSYTELVTKSQDSPELLLYQPFTKCSGAEQYRIAGLVPDSCST